MTAEQFSAEYHLLERVSTGAVETHHAHASAGAMVMVHYLRGSQQENDALCALIPRLRPDLQRKVMRTLEVDGVTVVVTRFILDLTTFQEWLHNGIATDIAPLTAPPVAQHVAPPPPPPAPVVVAPPPAAAGPGEITRMFAAQAPPAEPTPAPPEHAPGELTMMFAAVQPPPAAPPPAQPAPGTPPPPVLPEPPAARATPGELTRMFAPVTPPAPTAPPATQPAPPQPSSPFQWDPPLAPPSEPALFGDVTPPLPASEPGSYTRMFAAADVGPVNALPPLPSLTPPPPVQQSTVLPQSDDAYLQRLHRVDAPDAAPPSMPQPAAADAPFAAYGVGQPSEFTRVIAAFAPPPVVAAPAPAPPAPAAAPPAAKSGTRGYVIAAAVVIVVAIALIVVARIVAG